jgi:hypothetical protein
MKFSSFLLASLMAGSSSAFVSSSNRKTAFATTARYVATDPEISTGPSTDPVDKTLAGIDDAAEHDVFDPLGGEAPALIRNNKSEVWVQQVSEYSKNYMNI